MNANAEGFMGKSKLFNPTIDFGHILTALVMLGALIGVWHKLDSRQMLLESKQSELSFRQHEDREAAKAIASALSVVSQTQVRVVAILDAHLKEVGSKVKASQ